MSKLHKLKRVLNGINFLNKTKIAQNEKGQGLVEYLLLVALIAVGGLGIMRVFGQSINAKFATVTYAIQGKEQKGVNLEEIKDSYYKKKDMSDFFNGSVSESRSGQ